MLADVEKVCMEPLGNGILCLSHILFVAHFTNDRIDQIDQVRACTIDFTLARWDWPLEVSMNSSFVLRIGHNWHLTLVEKLLSYVDFLGVSLWLLIYTNLLPKVNFNIKSDFFLWTSYIVVNTILGSICHI